MWDLQNGVEQCLLHGSTHYVQVIVEVRVEPQPPISQEVPWWAIAVPIVVAVLLIIAVFVVLYIVSTHLYMCLHVCSFSFLYCLCLARFLQT